MWNEAGVSIDPLETHIGTAKDTLYFWIDILGFSDKSQNKEYEVLLELLKDFHKTFVENNAWYPKIISDGLLLKLNRRHTGNFSDLFTSVGNLQLKYILDNKEFIRGGFALGSDLDNTEKYGNIITNGLSKAVRIENRSINWPIIGTTFQEFETIANYYKLSRQEMFGLHSCFNSNGEKILYIDFLAHAEENQIKDYGRVLSQKIEYFAAKKMGEKIDEIKIYHVLHKYRWLYKHLLTYRPESKIPDIWEGALL